MWELKSWCLPIKVTRTTEKRWMYEPHTPDTPGLSSLFCFFLVQIHPSQLSFSCVLPSLLNKSFRKKLERRWHVPHEGPPGAPNIISSFPPSFPQDINILRKPNKKTKWVCIFDGKYVFLYKRSIQKFSINWRTSNWQMTSTLTHLSWSPPKDQTSNLELQGTGGGDRAGPGWTLLVLLPLLLGWFPTYFLGALSVPRCPCALVSCFLGENGFLANWCLHQWPEV